MVGIVGYGAHVPSYRIKVEEIAKVWGDDPNSISKGLVVNEKSLTFKRNISRDNNFYVFAVSTLLNSLGNRLSFKEGDIDVETHKDSMKVRAIREELAK